MKTRSVCVVLALLSTALFVIAQEAAGNKLPSGTITGGGKAHYIAAFSGATTVQDSTIYESSTANVGINTTSPAATLDVNGVINAATSFDIGGTPFAFGAYDLGSVFLGFAGSSNPVPNSSNTAIGFQALADSSPGNSNVAVGTNTLVNNTGSNNVGVGVSALYNNTGYANTAVGTTAGQEIGDGNTNTLIGYFASTVGGNGGTCVGAYCAVGNGLTNATAIGTFALVTENNALVLGCDTNYNGCTTSGGTKNPSPSVGIGTTAPTATLDVHDNGSGGSTISSNTSRITNAVYGGNSATSGSGANGGYFVTASPQGAGIVAVNTASGGTAGDFSGNVYISGTLTKTSGSFKIDHPLDPANKYLYHSFVESPDMMNVYNGNTVTDKHGIATVVLPDYFEALNRDFRYQLTVIGQFAQAMVAKEISNGRFTVKTSKPGVKVSWQVTGIRHDAYADAHRIQVEEEKPPQEQGRYLYPELFGAPAQQAIGVRAPSAVPPRVSSTTAQMVAAK